ncbi:hypothetical protein [Campylobacter concisus]|nr:hypothetical protein [Campylobacter concisus]
MLLIEKKLPKGYIVFFGSNCFQHFDNFYKACSFAIKLENFVKFVEMSDGVERDVIENKEKLKSLMSIRIQLEEQEAFAENNKKVLEVISQFRAL